MSLRGLIALYRARLRARAVLVQELLAILGITVGVALLFASQIAATSLSSSVEQVDRQVIGPGVQYQLQARSTSGFDGRLLNDVDRIPGVRSAFALLEQQASLRGPHGEASVDLVGVDPRFARLAGPLSTRFSSAQLAAQRALALPRPIADQIGVDALQTASIQVGGHVSTVLVGATLESREIGSMVNNPVAIAPIAYVQKLAYLGPHVSRIFIRAEGGSAPRLQSRLAALANRNGISLEPANFDLRLFSVAVGPDSQSEALFSAISALVGFVFALNAMLITVPSRRRLIEEVSRNGATRTMVIQILLFDALAIAVIAVLLGLVIGDLLSIGVFRSTPGYLAFAFPVGNNRLITAPTVALAVGAGLLASLIGVFWPLRDVLIGARRPRMTRFLRASRARIAVGLAALGLATLILLADASAAVAGEIALVVALMSLLPSLLSGITALIARAQRNSGGAASRLALTELQAPQTRVRSLAISATAALAVFGAVEFGGIVHNLSRALDNSAHGIDSMAGVWITPTGQSNAFATTSFNDVYRRSLEGVPGVKTVGSYGGSFLNWGTRRLWVLAPAATITDPIPSGQILAGSQRQARIRIRAGGWAVLSKALAEEHHLQIGQTFTLPAPHPVRLRLAALSTNLGWAPGAMILNRADYMTAWRSSAPSAYQLRLRPGASASVVARDARHVLGAYSGLVVETSRQRERRHYALAGQGLSRLSQIRTLLLIASILAVTGALGAMIWQRRERIAFIKCEGYPRSVLLRALLYESAALLVIGCAAGALFGLYGQLLGIRFLEQVTGFPILYGIEGMAALSSFGLMSGLALAIVALPGYLVVRVPARTVNPAY